MKRAANDDPRSGGAGLLCVFNYYSRHTGVLCCKIVPLFSLLFAFTCFGQTSRSVSPIEPVNRGLVVESVGKNMGAQAAGLKPGDVLLGWRSKAASGKFESPFDLSYVWYEQASRGPVVLQGIRNGSRKIWRLGGDAWGISSRPNFDRPTYSRYKEAQQLAADGKLLDAVNLFRTEANPDRSGNFPWLTSWFLCKAGEKLARTKAWPLVDESYQYAIQESRDLKPAVRAEIFRQWADEYASRDDFVNAERYRQNALVQWQKLGSETIAVADTLVSISEIELRQGDFDSAEVALRQAMSIGDKIAPAGIQAAVTLANFAVLYQDKGELDKAEEYYLKALRNEERRFPHSSLYVQTLSDLAVLFDQKGDLTRAGIYHRRALALAMKLNPDSLIVADIFSNLAECVLQMGDLTRAEQFHRQALTIRTKQLPGGLASAYDLGGLGRIARARGQFDKAEGYYAEALAIAEKIDAPEADRARLLIGLAAVFRKKKELSKAEELYREALALIERSDPDSIDRADTLAELASTLHEDHQTEMSAELFREALNRADEQALHLGGVEEDRPRYRAQHVRYYKEYMNVLIEQGRLQEAFELLESSHARTLLEMLSDSHVNVEQNAPSALLIRERKLQQIITQRADARIAKDKSEEPSDRRVESDSTIGRLLIEYQQLQAEIRENSPAYAALAHPVPLSLRAIRSLLDPNTILLEYSLGDEKSYLWAVTNDSLNIYQLGRRAEIEATARRVHRLLTSPNERNRSPSALNQDIDNRAYRHEATKLSDLLLNPVAKLLKRKRLVIVSEGALQYIPFSALPVPGKRTGEEPLIIDHEIVNLPSASILAELRKQEAGRAKAPKAVAILADPVFDASDERLNLSFGSRRSPFPAQLLRHDLARSAQDIGLTRNGKAYLNRLLYTRKEADAVMSVTPRGKGMLALDFEASRRTAMRRELADYRIVHFATHGILDNKHPELSGLVLSLVNERGEAQNGFLKLQDIYNLKLPVDLVVLSGCNTGLGEQINGEGLLGLTRGFMYAGATRVVASLWNVSDRATASLMADFYDGMERRGLSPAAALRSAQIRMWKQPEWSAPYYWAGFQIQGEWR